MPDCMKIPLSGAGSILEWESCGGSKREPWASGAEERRKETLSAQIHWYTWNMEVACIFGDLLGEFGEAKGRAMADSSLSPLAQNGHLQPQVVSRAPSAPLISV